MRLLAAIFGMVLKLPPKDTLDDWQTSAWDEQFPFIHQTLNQVIHPQ